MKSIFHITVSAVLFVFILGCGPKAIEKESEVDIPEYHYKLGVRKLDDGDYRTALSAFQRSVALDPKFAVGWGGMGLTQAYLGEIESGKESVDKAVDIDSKDANVWVWRGRFRTVSKDKKNWLEDAEDDFKKALKKEPGMESAEFYLGVAYLEAFNFQSAEAQFSKVVEMKGDYSKKANEMWQLAQKIVRASPGTPAGKKIALQQRVTRADLAVLFAEELKLSEVFKKMAPREEPAEYQSPEAMAKAEESASAVPTDVAGLWAEPWILEITGLGVMEVDPDGNFYPKETITRVNYAMAVQRILVRVTQDEELASAYFGETPSRFSDVASTHFAYNAMALCAERGIMSADLMTGNFNPTGEVSGADALLIIKEIQNAMRITF